MLNYEVTLRREVLREKSAGILADFNRYIIEKNISDNSNPIIVIKKVVRSIYSNIFNSEYDEMSKLNEANAKLDVAVEVLKGLH